MPERDTSEAQLGRLLALLPRAARAGGVPLAELADEMGVSPERLLADLEELYTREYYHPAGSGSNVQVLIEADEVEIFTTGEFRRPPRLTPRETLALGLGLRVMATETDPLRRPALLALAERLEAGVLGAAPGEELERIVVNADANTPGEIRETLVRAARERRRCEIAYLKPLAPEPERRTVDPYVLLSAGGKWYLVAFCHRSGDVRVFRADRVVAIEVGEERFTVPEGFEADAYVREGRVYRAGEEVEEIEVAVRFSPRIARWIEERGPVERGEDGSVVVHYRVADPAWLVRHVLEHGPDAEVLHPPEMRRRVAAVAARVAGERAGRAGQGDGVTR